MDLSLTWLPDKGIWATFPMIDGHSNRLFCWFGSSWTEDKALTMAVQINLPTNPSNRNISGRAVVDSDRPELVSFGHRGGLGGARQNVTIPSFAEAIQGFDRTDVTGIDGRLEKLFVIGPVQEANFLDKLADYVRECVRLRENARNLIGVVTSGSADETKYSPDNVEDGREYAMQNICARRGQAQFRQALREAYKDQCAISGCDVVEVLEAAHISPYLGLQTNSLSNGLLLRTDIHTLFDLYLITVNPVDLRIVISNQLRKSIYSDFKGKKLRVPKNDAFWPSRDVLQKHFDYSKLKPGK